MRCWLGHRDTPVSALHYIDVSYGEWNPTTAVTVSCRVCGRLRHNQLVNGHIELDDLVRRCREAA